MKNLTALLCGLLLVGGQLPQPLTGALFNFSQNKTATLRAKKTVRDYYRKKDEKKEKEEKKDLSDIVKALAYDSWSSLLSQKSSLKGKGRNIEHVHPFRFLETVFRNEELKAGIHAIRDRGKWVWSDFIGGLTGSLNEEANNQNLLPFTSDFAKNIHFSEQRILPLLKERKWVEFVNLLIDEIPREINPDRYRGM